jgi:hypothetical protein
MGHVEHLIASDRDWLTTLETVYKIKAVRDGDLVSLKYNQVESPMHEPIVQECRGMVVDVANARVLAHPYNKFWNHGEALAAEIDWSTAHVLEKLDGSLMILYWDPNAAIWTAASSGTPRGSGPFGDSESETFGEAFWRTFKALGMSLPPEQAQRVCFMFEFCDAPNRIVVRHEKPRIVLHGARTYAGEELPMAALESFGRAFNWEVVKSFPISSIADCLAAAETLDPIASEGFVVVDAKFNRVKIKSPRYVLLHHMKGEATPRRAIELWQTGETSELLGHFPEMAAQIVPVQQRLERIAAEAAADTIKAMAVAETRKDFAAKVKDKPWSSVAFKLYGSEPTFANALTVMRGSSLAALERMLEVIP